MKKILVSLFLLGGLTAAYAGSDCCPSKAAKTADVKAAETEAKVVAVVDSAKQCPMTAAKAETADMKAHCAMGADKAKMAKAEGKAHCSASAVQTAEAKPAGACGTSCDSAVKTAKAEAATCPMTGKTIETAKAAGECSTECGDECPVKVAGTTEESKDSETAAG